MPEKMMRLVKEQGFGEVRMKESDRPLPGADQVLVEVKRSLVSAGSELFARYVKEEAVSPDIMGYSDAGTVAEVGVNIRSLGVGDRVVASAPHAQYVLGHESGRRHRVFSIPAALDEERAPFVFLTRSSLMWADTTPLRGGETVVVLGQGLIGALYAQVVRRRHPGRVITVDGYPLRCDISRKIGADVVINCFEEDPVAAVRDLTGGNGAEVVVECVGGKGGIRSFEQAQKMLSGEGVLHLIGKYQGGPLPFYGDDYMNKVLVAGIRVDESVETYTERAVEEILEDRVNVRDLITHRLPWQETPAAYTMLYERPEEALGVVLEWA